MTYVRRGGVLVRLIDGPKPAGPTTERPPESAETPPVGPPVTLRHARRRFVGVSYSLALFADLADGRRLVIEGARITGSVSSSRLTARDVLDPVEWGLTRVPEPPAPPPPHAPPRLSIESLIAAIRAEGIDCDFAQLHRVPFVIQLDEPLRLSLSRGRGLRRVGSRRISIDALALSADH